MSSEIVGKIVELVEMDLDKFNITRFEATTVNQTPPNWVDQWVQGGMTFTASEDANAPSGRSGRILVYTATNNLFTWTLPGDLTNTSTVTLLRFNNINSLGITEAGVVLRASGQAPFETGYLALLRTPSTLIFYRYLYGALVQLTTAFTLAEPITETTDVYLRFDCGTTGVDDVLLRAKVWFGALGDEPRDFMFTYTDETTTILTAGRVGVLSPTVGADISIGHVRAKSLFGSETDTHRHARPATYVPRGYDAIPDIESISYTSAVVSLGENLGTRAQVQVAFKDNPEPDLGEMYDKGSRWGKFRARQLFRRTQPLRYRVGFHDQPLANYETNHFYLDSFNGPTPDGRFTITAQDLLKFADNDRAQAPLLNNGKLNAGITAVQTTATLIPLGIGDIEYKPYGHLALGGNEIVSFTRSGDTLTIVRGQLGTTAQTHAQEDRAQEVLVFSSANAADAIWVLLTQYAFIDPVFIPLEDWRAEVNTYLQRLYGRVIAEPTGVNKLIADLIEQAGLVLWWDTVSEQLRLQVLRSIPTTAFEYNPANTIAGSFQVQEQPQKRVTEVWTYYGVRNPLEPLDQFDNYRSNAIERDLEAATAAGSAIVKKIFGTWIPALAADTALRTCQLQLGRFLNPPRRVTFAVKRGSGVDVPALAGGYRFRYFGSQDEAGDSVNMPVQVVKLTPQADRYVAEAEEMLFTQFNPEDLTNRVITIDSDDYNINLRTLHDTLYPVPTIDDVPYVTLTVVVNSGVVVGSVANNQYSFIVGDWPVGFVINVHVNAGAKIQGAGGNGATASGSLNVAQPGGPAFYTRFPINLYMFTGSRIGGGGGGGTFTVIGGGGGTNGGCGGAGRIVGLGGTPAGGGAFGTNGTLDAGGTGAGCSGGGPGQAGQPNPSLVAPYNAAGAAGVAVDGISYVAGVYLDGTFAGALVN